ncbi:hypothetical protein [Rubinisphaera sp.]|uniref:hypothetical protein n=1 Tax=Rubinisphaera sp. TaxID=2024857 RepID=UPI000C10B665|nr:hypothetical protein [Rubinisphaera sp.]MBV07767.1 hypothetical protein [Rubinisphaera sp.]HCS50536.1 hypothetical protein [Planctomycetaceae bacterium]
MFDGNKLPGAAGFYPLDPNAIGLLNRTSKGKILVNEDGVRTIEKRYEVYAEWNIDINELEYIQKRVKEDIENPPDYDVSNYNCVNWAIDIVSIVDESVFSITDSDWAIKRFNAREQPNQIPFRFPGLTPGHFGEDLLENGNFRSARNRR